MDIKQKSHEFDQYDEDPLAPARGIFASAACGLVAWIICGVVFYLTFNRH